MNAQVAITLQTMGIEMDAVQTALTLEEAFKSLGIGRLEKKTSLSGSELHRRLRGKKAADGKAKDDDGSSAN